MARHKVSIVSLHYPPDTTGIAPYAGGLAAGLDTREFETSAYVAHPFYPEWKIRPGYGQWRSEEYVDGVSVRRLLHYVPRPPRGARRLLSELTFGVRLLLNRIRADSVICVSPALFSTALLVLRLRFSMRRRNLVIWVQDIYTLGLIETSEGGSLSTAITKSVEQWVFRSADRVVVIHPRFADYLADGLGIRRERISVIRNWTHLEPVPQMSQQDSRAKLGWPTDMWLVVHAGNMGAKQGLQNVVDAARLADQQQAPIKFMLIGDGGERPTLEKLADGIDRIEFIDPLDDSEYRSALAAADCLLVNELPGVASMAAPSKLTSYFDAARPILAATDAAGITAGEVEGAGAGVVVPAGDPAALLAMALKVSEDRQRAAAYGASGRRYRTEVLDSSAAISSFERVLREVAAERGRGRLSGDAESG